MDAWPGAGSWLQIVFRAPLLILGLGLEENEVFFRWLLIERARYFKQFPEQREPAWYVHKAGALDDGKRFFLEGVGIEPVAVQSYDAMYGPSVWERDSPTP